VRFIHAVPGVGTATVTVNTGSGEQTVGSIGFAQVSPWKSIRSGKFQWALAGGGKTLAKGTATVGTGAYDIVVLAKGSGVSLGVYKARGGERGTSLVRVIHAVPELGAPELKLDSKVVVHSLDFTKATPYLSVSPGVHSLAAMKAGDSAPLLDVKGVKFSPGVAYSGVVVGSRGQQVRVVTVVDRGGPLTRPASHKSSPSPTSASSGHVVVVRSGDSLWAIASRQVPAGSSNGTIYSKLVAIWDLNAKRIGTGDPNLIFPGQRLVMP
jgi:nucleoid-associated protein YgaU